MNEKNPTRTEAQLLEIFSAPNPNPDFAAHLRAELLKHHHARYHANPRRARLERLWSGLHAAGRLAARLAVRYSLSLAGTVLLIGLIVLGAFLLLGRPPGGEVGGAILETQPTATRTQATSTPAPLPLPTATLLAAPTEPARISNEVPTLSLRTCRQRITPAPSNAAYNRPGKLIGGGLARSGEYQINLYLFCDDAYGPDKTDGNLYSDIQGLGMYVSTWYGGQEMEGMSTNIGGVEPYLQDLGGTGIQRGAGVSMKQGLRVNYGQVLDWSGAEFRLRYVYKIHHPAGQVYGAALTFRLVRARDGFLVQDALVEPLSAEELSKPLTFSTARPPVPTHAEVTATATPQQPTPDPRAFYPLTLDEAEQAAGFALLRPAAIPQGLTLLGVRYDIETKVVQISFSNQSPNAPEGILLSEQLAPKGADCALCGFLQGDGRQVNQYPLGKLVSQDAKLETIQVGESTGQYVEGVWTSMSADGTWHWDQITYRKRLRFWKDGRAIEVWFDSNDLSKEDVIAFAEGLR